MTKADDSTSLDSASLRSGLVIHLLILTSGLTALVFEVLWMRELGLLLGNTAHAASTTLAAWFLGMAVGSWWWGPVGDRCDRPLRLYARLELGVAVAAVVGWWLLRGARAMGPTLLDPNSGTTPALRVVIALVLILPTTVLMGGTIPVLARERVDRGVALGRAGGWLVAVNTVGAAAGAWVTGFHLPVLFGVRGAWFFAAAVNALIALVAWLLPAAPGRRVRERSAPVERAVDGTWRSTVIVAAASGFLVLALEVLWTRLLAQVLQNSVYAFSAVLVVLLSSLAIGAAVASRLGRLERPGRALSWLLSASGAFVILSARWLVIATDGLAYVGGDHGFAAYVVDVLLHALLLVGVPCVVAGIVFPFLFHMVKGAGAPARTLGRLTAANLLGGVIGSLAAGFLVLPTFGVWRGMQVVAGVYVLLGCVSALRESVRPALAFGAGVLGLIAFTPLGTTESLVRLGPDERLVTARVGAHGVTAVTRYGSMNLALRLDNNYRLGTVAGKRHERRLTHIPLLIHPRPRSVMHIGLATGITAGASLAHDVERVVIAELVPDVHELARGYFGPHVDGLFDDDRVSIVEEDGRHLLATTSDRYDAVVCDLVMPWHARAGYLYTQDFYEIVRDRLAEGGVFAQWFAMPEWTAETFALAARSMAEVFPDVTVWRATDDPLTPIVGLVARLEPEPLVPGSVVKRAVQVSEDFPGFDRALPGQAFLMHYAGPLRAYLDDLPDTGLNTDDVPLLEFRAPVVHRAIQSGEDHYLAYGELARLFAAALRRAPPDRDPLLARLEARHRAAVLAGLAWFRHGVLQKAGFHDQAAEALIETLDQLGLPPR